MAGRQLKREISDIPTKKHEGISKNRRLLEEAPKEKTWHGSCTLCGASHDKRLMTNLGSDDLALSNEVRHEIIQRYCNNGKGMVCEKCKTYLNACCREVDEEIAISTFLIIRRDADRDFCVTYQGTEYRATLQKVGGLSCLWCVLAAGQLTLLLILRRGVEAKPTAVSTRGSAFWISASLI